jgi:TatD DNase family protein
MHATQSTRQKKHEMIDIGVNLTNSQLSNRIPEVLTSAYQAGVEQIVVTGTDLPASKEALNICEKYQSDTYPSLYSTAGVHPHDAKDWNQETERQLRELLTSPRVVAVGETGLDFNRNYSLQEDQIKAFEAQLQIAIDAKKPLFLHERDAFETQIKILNNYGKALPPVVIHCFTGDKASLHTYLENDFYIGITGWVCDERRGKQLAEIVADIPLNRLLIETDAPFLLPRNIAPKPESRTNYPSYLPWVVKKLAECYQLSETDIKQATINNAKVFFNI